MDAITKAQKPLPAVDRSFSTSFLERPSSNGQDSSAMTIEFLRARLQSERSVSRAARERAEQLAQKVFELEQRLESEIQLRKKLESARLEVLSKYRGELNTEYGNIFDSNLEEGDSDRTTGGPKEDSHAGVASSSRSDDIERWEHERAVGEGFLQPVAIEHDEGSRMGNSDRVDSPGHFNFEEDGNEGSMNDDEETDQNLGNDKGILAWGRRGRRQQSMARYTRSFSRISSDSTDAESPNKRWTGKSVRQKRRTESRVQDTNSEESNGQAQDHEDVEDNTAHPEERKGLQCNMERETEVERVLERQAELIEQFEAEENAQKAWEERFTEQNPSRSNGAEIQPQNKEESSISNLTDEKNSKDEGRLEEGATHFTESDGNLSSQHEDLHLEKAHLHDRLSKETYLKEGLTPPPSQTTLEDSNIVGSEMQKPALIATDEVSFTSDALQGDSIFSLARDVLISMEKESQERQQETAEDAKSNKAGEVAWFLSTSQKQIDSSDTDIQGGEKDVRASSGRHGGVGKLDRHSKLSSSFKFNAFLASPNQNLNLLTENVLSSSPQLQDHATGLNAMKKTIQNPSCGLVQTESSFSDHAQAGNASGPSSDEIQTKPVSQADCKTPSALRESREQDKESKGSFWSAGASGQDSFQALNLHASRAASNQHPVQRPMSVFSDKPNALREVAAMQDEAVAEFPEGTTQTGRTQSPWEGRNGSTDSNLTHGYSDRNSSHGYSDKKSSQGYSNSVWEDVFRRRIGTQEATSQQEQAGRPRTLYGLSAHPDLHMEKPAQQYASANPNRAKLPPFAARRCAIPDDSVPSEYNVDRHSYQDTAFASHRRSVDGGFDRVMDVLRALQVAKQHIQSSGEQESDLNTSYRSRYDGRDALHVDPGSYSPSPQYTRDAATTAPYLSTHVTERASSPSKQPSYALRRAEQKPYRVPHGAHNSSVYHHDAR